MLPSLPSLPGGGSPYTLNPPANSPVVLAGGQGAQGCGPLRRVASCTTPHTCGAAPGQLTAQWCRLLGKELRPVMLPSLDPDTVRLHEALHASGACLAETPMSSPA